MGIFRRQFHGLNTGPRLKQGRSADLSSRLSLDLRSVQAPRILVKNSAIREVNLPALTAITRQRVLALAARTLWCSLAEVRKLANEPLDARLSRARNPNGFIVMIVAVIGSPSGALASGMQLRLLPI